MERYVTTLKDGQGVARSVVITRASEGIWLAQCQLPGQGLLDGTSMKRRDAVATVERKLTRATGGGRSHRPVPDLRVHRGCDSRILAP